MGTDLMWLPWALLSASKNSMALLKPWNGTGAPYPYSSVAPVNGWRRASLPPPVSMCGVTTTGRSCPGHWGQRRTPIPHALWLYGSCAILPKEQDLSALPRVPDDSLCQQRCHTEGGVCVLSPVFMRTPGGGGISCSSLA